MSGRTGVAFGGQTIMITLGLAAGSTSWMESSSAAVMWPVASTMGKDVDTVTPGVIEVPGGGAYENRDRLRGSEARLNKLTA